MSNNFNEKLRVLADKMDKSVVYKQQVWSKRDDGFWDKFWSAYHALRDAQDAVEEWKKNPNPQRLEMYGILQALVVQQDALRHLQEAIEVETINIKNDYPELEKIRIARHQLIGHPTETTNPRNKGNYRDGTLTYTTIGYGDNSKVIEYLVASGKGTDKHTLSLGDVIEIQESVITNEIDKIMAKIDIDDKQHKSVFEVGVLQKKLHTSTYLASKAYSFERDPTYAKISIESLMRIYDDFKKEICRMYRVNSIDETIHVQGLVGELEKVDKVLPRIHNMILHRDEVDDLDLDVYAESLCNSFRLLQTMAEEIDAEFNTTTT